MTQEDELLPARAVWVRYKVCDRTLDRWLADPRLGFPKPIYINRRRYWRVGDIVRWEAARCTSSPR